MDFVAQGMDLVHDPVVWTYQVLQGEKLRLVVVDPPR